MFSGQCIHMEGHSPSRVVVRTVTSTSPCYYNWDRAVLRSFLKVNAHELRAVSARTC